MYNDAAKPDEITVIAIAETQISGATGRPKKGSRVTINRLVTGLAHNKNAPNRILAGSQIIGVAKKRNWVTAWINGGISRKRTQTIATIKLAANTEM